MGHGVKGTRCEGKGVGFGVWGSGCGVWGEGCRVHGSPSGKRTTPTRGGLRPCAPPTRCSPPPRSGTPLPLAHTSPGATPSSALGALCRTPRSGTRFARPGSSPRAPPVPEPRRGWRSAHSVSAWSDSGSRLFLVEGLGFTVDDFGFKLQGER